MRKVQIAFVLFGVAYCSLLGWQTHRNVAGREAISKRIGSIENRTPVAIYTVSGRKVKSPDAVGDGQYILCDADMNCSYVSIARAGTKPR